MHSHTSKLRYASAVSFTVLFFEAFVGLYAVSPSTQTAAPRVSARTLNQPLTSTIPLLINEVYDSTDSRREYFELVNTSTITSPQTIDLYNYTIYNSDTNPVG